MALRALMQKYGPAAAISYSSVTLTFFSTIYATLTFGYDPSPFILEIVSHAAMAGLDLKPWMTDIGALDAKGEPTDKLRHGSTFVTTMLDLDPNTRHKIPQLRLQLSGLGSTSPVAMR